jgi:hypothetical protein
MEGQRGSPGMLPSSEYQNGMRPVTPTRDASSAAHHNGMSNGDSNGLVTKGSNRSGQTHGAPIIDTGSFSQLSNASSRSVSPHGYCAPCLGSLVGLSQSSKTSIGLCGGVGAIKFLGLMGFVATVQAQERQWHWSTSGLKSRAGLLIRFTGLQQPTCLPYTGVACYDVLRAVHSVQYWPDFKFYVWCTFRCGSCPILFCLWMHVRRAHHEMSLWMCDDCIGHDGAELTDARRWWQPETVAESTRGC